MGMTSFALDAKTGQILWEFVSGGSVNSGPAVADGTVYWGSGYESINNLGIPLPGETPNNKLYAFTPLTPAATAKGR
jgi:polyvinyl alcohol dehydrogenase (cytochrome)